MKTTERIFQVILYEAIALTVQIPVTMWVYKKDMLTVIASVAGLVTIATIGNYIFNIVFDKIFGANRIQRTWRIRIIHMLSFEASLVVICLPFIMYSLNMDFKTAFIYDINLVVLFALYAFIFHLVYDHVRHWLLTGNKHGYESKKNE